MKEKTKVISSAHLVSADEKNVPNYGLLSVAWYKIDGLPGQYKIEYWNRHAPVEIKVAVVSVDLEGLYMFINKFGMPVVRENNFMYTDDLMFACPIREDGLYWMGYDPLVLAARYINKHMVKIEFRRVNMDEFWKK